MAGKRIARRLRLVAPHPLGNTPRAMDRRPLAVEVPATPPTAAECHSAAVGDVVLTAARTCIHFAE